MQATVGIGVMVVFLAWTSSTVIKVLLKVLTIIDKGLTYIYFKYNSILDAVLLSLFRIIDLIKEKLQTD
jgi:hypothetical protein